MESAGMAIPLTPASAPIGLRAALRETIGLLTKRDQRRFWGVVAAQMATALLDLVGVLLIGLVGVLASAASQGGPLPTQVDEVLALVGADNTPALALAGYCTILAAAFLLAKSLVSAVLMRKVFRFLGSRQAAISTRLTADLLSQPLAIIERRPSQEVSWALSTGVTIMVTAMLGALALLLSEFALLGLLFIALAFLNPAVTLAAVAFFGAVGFGIHRGLSQWAARVGTTMGATTVVGQQRLQEAIASFREVWVFGRQHMYITAIGELWQRGGTAQGDSLFLMQLPKIAYETALVVGGVALAAWQFQLSTPTAAITTVVVFVAAGSRVFPSMLRINSLTLSIRTGVSQATALFPIMRELTSEHHANVSVVCAKRPEEPPVVPPPEFQPTVEVQDVTFRYVDGGVPAIDRVSLLIPTGSRVALVGPTGAGKSTLADLILGVVKPELGSVRISGMDVETAIARWPGAIAYVPQHVAMANGTVRANVALGLPADDIDDQRVWAALEQAHLAPYLKTHRDGLDTAIGERGLRLSGGQRQRLGLARALYVDPRLLVLDEATSALDMETEKAISETLAELSRSVTTITVAHRLATIREAKMVVYMESGKVAAVGTFDEVRTRSTAFDRQATLAGITQ